MTLSLRTALQVTTASALVPQPAVLLVESHLKRHAVLAALLEPRCRVDGVVGVSGLAGMSQRRYDLAIINMRAVGLVTGTVLVRRLRAQRPRALLILATSIADAHGLVATIGKDSVVLSDPPPMGDLLKCVARSLAHPGMPSWSQPVIRVAEELSGPASHTLAVGEIVRRAGVSRSQLTHRFRKEVGVALRAYLLRVATNLAALLLRHTEAKIEAIAIDAGFCDASHLSRVFYRYTGCRPGTFRREDRPLGTLRCG